MAAYVTDDDDSLIHGQEPHTLLLQPALAVCFL